MNIEKKTTTSRFGGKRREINSRIEGEIWSGFVRGGPRFSNTDKLRRIRNSRNDMQIICKSGDRSKDRTSVEQKTRKRRTDGHFFFFVLFVRAST
jgi:hypothetical protein